MGFTIKEISQGFEQTSIQEVGFDPVYVNNVVDKYEYKVFKIFDLTPQQASIIKQTALSLGTDSAVHREVLTCKIEKSDIILGGSVRQLKCICKKLEGQPFSLKKLADELIYSLEVCPQPLNVRGKTFDWGKKTYVAGILNITPDSFSDGGEFLNPEQALERAKELAWCCDIIDIGGESTRPYSEVVDVDDEINRICPVIKSIRKAGIDAIISVDTRNSKTAKEAIKAGADIVNDVSGGDYDKDMLEVVAQLDVPYILMHSFGIPQNMQDNPEYENVVDEIYLDLNKKIDRAIEEGIKKENLIIDIGVGFGKNLEHNLEILKRLQEFKSFGCPIMTGVSRKSFMNEIVGMGLEEKDVSTLAINALLVSKGVDIVRVHNPQLHKKALAVIDRLDRN